MNLFASWFDALSFRGAFPLWAALVTAFVFTCFIFLAYFRESMKISVGRRIVMASLRSLMVTTVLVLMCKPVWEYSNTLEKPRPIVVLIDTTQSMKQSDPRPELLDQIRLGIVDGRLSVNKNVRDVLDKVEDPATKMESLKNLYPTEEIATLTTEPSQRLEVVKSAFTNPQLRLLPRLKTKGPLQLKTFGSDGTPVLIPDPEQDGSWTALQALQPQTALFGGIYQTLKVENDELPAAVVVVTDGLNNIQSFEDQAQRKPIDLFTLASLCKKLQVPLHIYGVGGAASRLLNLKELDVNTTLFVEDNAKVRVAWRARGVKSGKIRVEISLDGKPVRSEVYNVKEGEHIEETLSFEPKKEDAIESAKQGKLNLTATVSLEGSSDRDTFTKSVRVVENKVKVLLIDSTPRWEFKFLQRTFLRDRRVEPWFIIVNSDKETLKSGKPFLPEFPKSREQLFEYDLLILGDVNAGYFSTEQKSWIRDFVSEGGGLVMIAGRQNAPASYFGTPIGDMLPVDFQSNKFPIEDVKRPIEFKPRLSDVGKRSSMMSLADNVETNEQIWQSLPGWYWYYPTTRLKPAAVTLLEHPKQENEDKRPMPLMAMHYFGRGLVLFDSSDETWRWRWNDDNEPEKYFARFWGQVIYQIGLPRALGGRSQLGLGGGEAVLGQPGKVYARLYTKEFLPLRDQQVKADLVWNDAPMNSSDSERQQKVVFEAVPNQPGEYVMTLPHDRAGKFTLRLGDGQEKREGSTLEYRVTTPPGSENAPGNLDEETLMMLAKESGGAYYREEDLYQLPDAIATKKVQYANPHNVLLFWEQWWVLVFIASLLTLEWLVRKFSNMS